jgi:hypothetical protein
MPASFEPSVASRLLGSSAGFALAVALAIGAARCYVPPGFGGSARGSGWFEPDSLCSFASSAVALTVGAWSGRAARGAGAAAAGSALARVAIWAAFTLFFGAIWLEYTALFALLLAPSHAFACLRLVGLLSRWRADWVWRRQR